MLKFVLKICVPVLTACVLISPVHAADTSKPRTSPSHSTRTVMPKMAATMMRPARDVPKWLAASRTFSAQAAAQNGIAHFLEHMAFKGTAKRTSLQIAEEIEDVGGYINAYTSKEMTAYYARCLVADVPLALDVISDIVLNPVFDEREIEVERHVILQEIGQALDTPDDIIFDWLQEVSYPDQAFGRTILGLEERVANFTRDDLVQFVREHYGPDQMILSASGGVDHDSIVHQAREIFGHLPARGISVVEPAAFIGGERREVKKLEQVHFALSLEAPGYRHPDVYTAQVYAMTMGGGMSSRLFQRIREERGLVYGIHCFNTAYADGGLFAVAPDQVAMHEAEHFMRIDAARIRMLSIGTATSNYRPASDVAETDGAVDWLAEGRLLLTLISVQQQHVQAMMEDRLRDRYVRLDAEWPAEAELGIDVATADAAQVLESLAHEPLAEPRTVRALRRFLAAPAT